MSPEHQELLRDLAQQSHCSLMNGDGEQAEASVDALLGGTTTETINAMLGRELRRADGIFFSGPAWAQRLREALPHGPFRRFVDPSCGIGDLLIEMARYLPLGGGLSQTLESWSKQFYGMDLHMPLAQLARYRLQALARGRHGIRGPVSVSPHLFGRFSAQDALEGAWELCAGDCVLMNPPFQAVVSPSWSKYCGGRVSAAALFLERALTDAQDGVTIVALVPEAIRSGSRFSKLRDYMHSRGIVHQFTACGRFSSEADIDVAILSITVGAVTGVARATGEASSNNALTLSDLAVVRVGTVVPHRDPKTVTSRPFLDVDGAPVWQKIEVLRRARFVGSGFKPPFVVVRRTSSPSDRERARATVVKGKEAVMVENHLLVLLPAKKTVKACEAIMKILSDPRTTDWLNEMLRCRHLTVRVMRQLPVWTED